MPTYRMEREEVALMFSAFALILQRMPRQLNQPSSEAARARLISQLRARAGDLGAQMETDNPMR